MNLALHELSHILLSVIVGLIMYKRYKKLLLSFLAALIGGFFVDLDHLIDYWLAFGWDFNLKYFLKGYQFLVSDKIYVPLHGWEWVIVLPAISFVLKRYTIIAALCLAFAFGLATHLVIDTFVNDMKPQSYFISYRILHKFDAQPLVTSEHWVEHQKRKQVYKILK